METNTVINDNAKRDNHLNNSYRTLCNQETEMKDEKCFGS